MQTFVRKYNETPVRAAKQHANDVKPYISQFGNVLDKRETSREMTANIVALGVIVGATKVVSEEALKEAVLDRIPAGTEEMNLKALEAGLSAGKKSN